MGAAASLQLPNSDPEHNEVWARLRKECHDITPVRENDDEIKSVQEELIQKYKKYSAYDEDSAFDKIKDDYLTACVGEPQRTHLRGLDQIVDSVVYTSGQWPLVWDPSGQSGKFFKYQGGVYLQAEDPRDMQPDTLRTALVGCLQHGNTLAIDLGRKPERQIFDFFVDTLFPREVLSRELLYSDDVIRSLLRPGKGDPDADMFLPRDEFRLVVISSSEVLPRLTAAACSVIEIKTAVNSQAADNAVAKQEQEDKELEEAFGLREKIRNSKELVEAAFDGDLDAVKSWLGKDYHLESRDGQKSTALSEAACAGKLDCVAFLLEEGAEPNTINVRNRTPLYRAAFHGHFEVCELLLSNGADPDITANDPQMQRKPQDVAKTPEVKDLLVHWDRDETKFRMKERRKQKEAALMKRCRTAAERSLLAKAQLRDELVQLAVAGDVAAIKAQLNKLADEAEALDEKPRANAQSRDERGHTLLAIAAWKGHAELAELLCSHWEQYKCPEGSFLDEFKTLRQAWRVDVNARNCQGWTPVALAVFHNYPTIVRTLLAHGADPTKRNSRKISPFQLAAKNEVILPILQEWGEDHKLGVHEMDTSMATDVVNAGNPLAAVVSPTKGAQATPKKKKKKKTVKGGGGKKVAGKKKVIKKKK